MFSVMQKKHPGRRVHKERKLREGKKRKPIQEVQHPRDWSLEENRRIQDGISDGNTGVSSLEGSTASLAWQMKMEPHQEQSMWGFQTLGQGWGREGWGEERASKLPDRKLVPPWTNAEQLGNSLKQQQKHENEPAPANIHTKISKPVC